MRKTLSVAGIVASLLLVTSCASGTGSEPDGGAAADDQYGMVTLGIQSPVSMMPQLAAMEMGYFEEEGFSGAESINFTSIPAMFAALDQGQLTAAAGVPLAVISYNADENTTNPLVNIDATTAPNIVWVVSEDSDVPAGEGWEAAAAAMEGKLFGAPAVGGIAQAQTEAMIRDVGGDPASGTFTAVGTTAAMVAALENGTIEVAVSGDPAVAMLAESSGVGKTVMSQLEGEGPEAFTRGFVVGVVTTQQALDDKSEEYAAFMRASEKGRDFLKDPSNEAKVKELLTSAWGVPAEIVDDFYTDVIPKLVPDELTATMAQETVDGLVAAGIIEADWGPAAEWVQGVEGYLSGS